MSKKEYEERMKQIAFTKTGGGKFYSRTPDGEMQEVKVVESDNGLVWVPKENKE